MMIKKGIRMFGKALDELMKEQKITNKFMSEKLYDTYGYTISKESIAKYRNNTRTPEPILIKYFCDILHTSSDYLFGLERKSVASVPIIGTASCGGTDINYLQERGRQANYNGEAYNPSMYCVIANGDSMASEIEDGDELICDPKQKPESGDIVHYRIGDESAVKVLWIDKDVNILQLVPYNQSETFKTTTIRMDDEQFDDLEMTKVVSINKLTLHNKSSRLKMIGRT